MKILIIGSRGFIGQHILNRFRLKSNYSVFEADIVVDNLSPNYTRINSLESDFDAIFKSKAFDLCINCSGAANVLASLDDPFYDYQLNSVNVFRILNAIRMFSPKCRYINLSSAAVYGNPSKIPILEESQISPVSPYGFHKHRSELICKEFYQCYGIRSLSLRIFSAYGPGLQKQLMWDLYNKISNQSVVELWGTGKESRDFIYIDDIVNAVELLIENSSFNADVVNIANGNEVRIDEIVDVFVDVMKCDIKILFNNINQVGYPINWCADISKLKNMGYKTTVDIYQGINKYLRWITEKK